MVSEKSSTRTSISTAIAVSSPAKEAVSAKKSSGRLLLLRCAAGARRLRANRPGLLEAARYADPLLPEDRPARWCAEFSPIPILSLQHPACDVYGKSAENQYVGGGAPISPAVRRTGVARSGFAIPVLSTQGGT